VIAKGLDAKTAKLRDFGANEVISVKPDDDVSRARELMQQHKVQRILVCDEQKKPVGVISLQDLAQAEDERSVGETVQKVKTEGATAH
jgi:CBS domain-containing protein